MVKVNRRSDLAHLPGDYGLPLLGKNIPLMKDPMAFFQDQYRQYGPVSRTSFGGYRIAVVVGPDCLQQMMLDKDKNFSAEGGWGAMMPDIFRGSILTKDFDEHRIHRRIMQTAFKSDTLREYIPQIEDIVDQSIARWAKQDQVLYFHESKRLLLEVAYRIFCFVDESEHEREQVNQAFIDMMEGAVSYVRLDCPGFLYHRAMKSRRYLAKYFESLVEGKRNGDGKDAFTYFCKEKKENGEYFTDTEIAEHMVFLMLGAHDTTTSATTMAAYYLANDQALQDKLSMQAQNTEISLEDIRQNMDDMECVLKETLRLHPPVSTFFRSTLKDCTIDGQRIPANTLVACPTSLNQQLNEWWMQPQAFKPERFSDLIKEHKKHSFMWAPFGGGAHKCIGLNFADILFKVLYQKLLKDYRIEFAKPGYYPAELQQLPFAKPLDDLPIKLIKRKKV